MITAYDRVVGRINQQHWSVNLHDCSLDIDAERVGLLALIEVFLQGFNQN